MKVVILVVLMAICAADSVAHGGLLFHQCSTWVDCPAASKCINNWCDGMVCVCDNNALPSPDKSACLPGVQVGSACNQKSVCKDPSSECVDGLCACKFGYIKSESSGRCLEKEFDGKHTVDLDASCSSDDVICAYDLECVNKKCACPDGYRVATEEETTADPYINKICRPKAFKLGATVDPAGPSCPGVTTSTTTSTSRSTTTPTTTSTTTTAKPKTAPSTPRPTTTSSTTTPTTTSSTSTTTTAKPTSTKLPTTSTTQTTSTMQTTSTSTTSTSTTSTPTTSTSTTSTPTTSTPITSTSTTSTSTTSTPTTSTPTTSTSTTSTPTTSTSTTSTSTTSTASTTTPRTTTITTTAARTTTMPTTTLSTTPSTEKSSAPSPITASSTTSVSSTSTSTAVTATSSTTTTARAVESSSSSTTAATFTETTTPMQNITVPVGSNCGQAERCPGNAVCERDSCEELRCRCSLGYATSPDNTECWKLAALGESCLNRTICQSPFTNCDVTSGVCQCADEYERSDSGRWCSLRDSWFISFPLEGEKCSGGFFSDCYMDFEQSCVHDRCTCKEGLRPLNDIDRDVVYPDIIQCRNASDKEGARDRALCKNQLRQTRDNGAYTRAKAKIRTVQGAIIGGSVGFVALVGIIIGSVALFRWKRRGRRQTIRDTSSMASTDGQSSRYSFKIPRPFASFNSAKEFQHIAYPNILFEGDDHVAHSTTNDSTAHVHSDNGSVGNADSGHTTNESNVTHTGSFINTN